MTKYRKYHPRSCMQRLTLPRTEGGRGLIDITNLHNRQITTLRQYFFDKTELSLLHKIIVQNDHKFTPLNLQDITTQTNEKLIDDRTKFTDWAAKSLHGRHLQDLCQPSIDKMASNAWLSRGELFPETEGFMVAIQDQRPEHEMVTLTARRMYQAHIADYIKECFENITEEFTIEKACILSITTDGGANMVAAVKQFLGYGKRIPCMAHLLNLIVDGATRDNATVLQIANRVKAIVTYFKQSVNAMDDLRAEQEATLIQSVSTRWNSCLDMLERFNTLSAIVAKILATRQNAPDMITSSELSVIRDLIILFTPFKQANEEISGDKYVTASLAIPIANLLQKGLEQVKPFTEFGVGVQNSLLNLVIAKLEPLERHLHLAKATILDPRFKRIHFNSALAVSTAITALSKYIRLEHRRRGLLSPKLRSTTTTTIPNSENSSPSLWSGHEKNMIDVASYPP
ncbi:LOW QUALITY PROTEIN: uncharacterized protein ACR2FA_012824 [Aphomia sociella]